MKTAPFTTHEYLNSPEMVEAYLTAARETGEPDVLAAALADVGCLKMIEFDTTAHAWAWQSTHGGWVFVPEDATVPAMWFDAAQYTPTKIMQHRATRGLNGRITCKQ